jgi:hypothetical protein
VIEWLCTGSGLVLGFTRHLNTQLVTTFYRSLSCYVCTRVGQRLALAPRPLMMYCASPFDYPLINPTLRMITIILRLVFSVTVFTALLGNLFQQSSRRRRLATISHQPPTLLTSVSGLSQSQSYVTTNGQSASVLVSRTHQGPDTRCLLLLDSCGFLDMRRPIWREDGSVVYNCCWTSPAPSFSVPSSAGLTTKFYCLRFETPQPGRPGPCIYIPEEQIPQALGSLFVAAYDSQDYGGCIRTRLHAGVRALPKSKLK